MATSKQHHDERVQALTNILDLGISASSRIFSEVCAQDELADLTLADLIGADDAEDERAEQEIRRYFDPI
tara:strand:- start:326 stop:535 length:210 start_codon:yes stop_codon:yes gene_type:complete